MTRDPCDPLRFVDPLDPLTHCHLSCADGREADRGRDIAHGGHGAVLRRPAVGHEATVDRHRGPTVLRALQRVPA